MFTIPQGMLLFLIVRSDQEKQKNLCALCGLAVQNLLFLDALAVQSLIWRKK
jgi:hypothetical protein